MIRRGDFVVVGAPGDYGKPCPALVVQSELFSALPSVSICLLTSTIRQQADLLRLSVEPTAENGLQVRSQVMIDKITTVPATKVGQVIGHADDTLMVKVNRALVLFLGIG